MTLEAGAKAILKAIDGGKIGGKNVIQDISTIAEVVEDDVSFRFTCFPQAEPLQMGGTSGALYSIFFSGLGKGLRDAATSGAKSTTPEVWSKASKEALEILYKCKSPRH